MGFEFGHEEEKLRHQIPGRDLSLNPREKSKRIAANPRHQIWGKSVRIRGSPFRVGPRTLNGTKPWESPWNPLRPLPRMLKFHQKGIFNLKKRNSGSTETKIAALRGFPRKLQEPKPPESAPNRLGPFQRRNLGDNDPKKAPKSARPRASAPNSTSEITETLFIYFPILSPHSANPAQNNLIFWGYLAPKPLLARALKALLCRLSLQGFDNLDFAFFPFGFVFFFFSRFSLGAIAAPLSDQIISPPEPKTEIIK